MEQNEKAIGFNSNREKGREVVNLFHRVYNETRFKNKHDFMLDLLKFYKEHNLKK